MENNQERLGYDLEERTSLFAIAVLTFCRSIPHTTITKPLVSQLIRSGTSIAANYAEATEGESRKDFSHKIAIAKKEAKETKLWLRLIGEAHEKAKDDARKLWKEAHELNLILAAIRRKTRR